MTARRIIQVSAYYPPHLGGQEVVVQDLSAHLASIGEEVEIVTSSLGANSGVTVENGVRVTRLKSWEFGHTAIIWGLFCWLLRHAKRETVVHLHVGQFFTPEIVWLASKIVGFNYIIHMHINPVQSGPIGKLIPLYKHLLLKREVRDAKVVVVLNDEHKKIIETGYSRKTKVMVMSNGVDGDFFNISRGADCSAELRLLFVGRLSPQKNLAVLLEAFANVRTGATLDIVGDGECRRDLERFIRDKNLVNVTIHGRLSRDKIKEYYSACSALILPSLYEAQPVVLLEAMASRIPVIATKVIGIESQAKGSAILVEPTVEGIADGILRFSAMSSADIDALTSVAYKKVEMLEWDSVVESYVRLYEQVARQSLPA